MAPAFAQLDHVMIQVDEPEPLFWLFRDRLGLPVAVDPIRYPPYHSALVTLGAVNVEFLTQPGQPRLSTYPGAPRARLHGLAFEPSGSLDQARAVLSAARVPHGPTVHFHGRIPPSFRPFCEGDVEGGWLHSNVEVGGLLSERPVLLGSSSRALGGVVHSLAGGVLTRALGFGPLAKRMMEAAAKAGVFDEPLTQLVAYGHDVARRRRSNLEQLHEAGGGVLGVVGLETIIVSVRQPEDCAQRWQGLVASNAVELRLVPDARNAIRALVLGVASLARARESLERLQMLGDVTPHAIHLRADAVFDLDIRLRRARPTNPERLIERPL